MKITVQPHDFDAGEETAALSGSGVGGIVSFVGLVRGDDEVLSMTLEHYPGMTERALQDIAEEAVRRWNLLDVSVIHRYGRLRPGERIVYVGTAAAHRREAFEACEFIMDYLKTRAPFWKYEETHDGGRWVDARAEDEFSAERWQR